MFLPTQLTITEVRRDMSRFADRVIHEEPAIVVRRGRRDSFWAIDDAKFRDILRAYRFTLDYDQAEDGRFYGSLREIEDVIGEGDTIEELTRDLARYLLDYARGYAEDIKLFYNAPNRRSHFPYILNVLSQDSIEDVVGLID